MASLGVGGGWRWMGRGEEMGVVVWEVWEGMWGFFGKGGLLVSSSICCNVFLSILVCYVISRWRL